MNDSLITILVIAAVGVIQLVAGINKKKRAQEQAMRRPPVSYMQDFEERMPQVVTALPVETEAQTDEAIIETIEEESLLDDFTPQKAILFSEVLNPKWNS